MAQSSKKTRLSDDQLARLFSEEMGWGPLTAESSHSKRNIFSFLLEASHACQPETVVLDISAGQCRYKPFFQHCQYIGVDSCVGDANWDFSKLDVVGDALSLPVASESIDICVNLTSLEHYPEPERAFEEIARVLKPGGSLYLYVPFALGEHQAPYDFFRYTRYSLARFCQRHGLEIEQLNPTNGIFETAMSIFKIAVDHVPNAEIQKNLAQVHKNLLPIFRELEDRIPQGRTPYPDKSPVMQFPTAYCLRAAKSKPAGARQPRPSSQGQAQAERPGSAGHLKRLRINGLCEQALEVVGNLAKADPKDAELVLEIIRILILTGNPETAGKYLQFLQEHCPQSIDEEIVLRLRLLTALDSKIDLPVREKDFGWIQIYHETNADQLFRPVIVNCELVCDARSNYLVALECPSCKTAYTLIIVGTLLIHKTYYCPECLAKQLLNFEMIKTFIQARRPELLGETVEPMNEKIRQLRDCVNDASNARNISHLARALNQDAVFAVNQLIIKDAFSSN